MIVKTLVREWDYQQKINKTNLMSNIGTSMDHTCFGISKPKGWRKGFHKEHHPYQQKVEVKDSLKDVIPINKRLRKQLTRERPIRKYVELKKSIKNDSNEIKQVTNKF